MFHACEVKIAKIAAHSKPSSEPGNNAMNPVMVIERNPRIGTDCRMSNSGIKTFSARRSLAAAVAYTKVKTSDKPRATNILSDDRAA